MSGLLMLMAMITILVGVAALVLALIEAITITIPEFLIKALQEHGSPTVPPMQRSTDQNKL